MAPCKDADPHYFQAFKNKDGRRLQKIPVLNSCPETGIMFILWQDVQNAFPDVDYVDDIRWGKDEPIRAHFLVGPDGEVIHPLRISCAECAYRVIYREKPGLLSPAQEFQCLYKTWMETSEILQGNLASFRPTFQELASNVRYHYSKVLDQLTVLKEMGLKIEAAGKTEDRVLQEIQEHGQNMARWNYANIGTHILSSRMDYPAPFLFVVLPADLASWDDSDPGTHTFRLYFLCDVNFCHHDELREWEEIIPMYAYPLPTLPEHKHFSNHSGYNLVRPQEFFETYGSYTLMILMMVRHGFYYRDYEIPRLDTFEILWGNDIDSPSNHLSKFNIESLVNKAISYLKGLSLPLRGSEVWLTERESVTIKDFLNVPDGCDTLGGLNLYCDQSGHRYWTCKQHVRQWLTPGTLEVLVDFVHSCGGQVDTQQATLHVELQSRSQVDRFCSLLKDTELRFHISIIFGWKEVQHQDLKHFLERMVDAKVRYLELDGISCGIHPQDTLQYRSDVFAETMFRGDGLWFVALFNYPRPGEQYTYLARHSRVYWLRSKKRAQVHTRDYCDDLRSKTGDFVMAIVQNNRDGLIEVSQNLRSLLVKDGFEQVSLIGCYEAAWHGQFDLKEGVLREFQHREFIEWSTPVALEVAESLHTLTVDSVEARIGHKVLYLVQACHQLQELNISLQESRALEWVEIMVEMWQSRSSPLQLTLMERGELGRGHIIVQLVVFANTLSRQGDSKPDLQRANDSQESSQDWRQGPPELIKVLKWNCDHVSTALTIPTAAILDIVTENHPSMMTSLVLDISHLRHEAFPYLQNILRDSMLGHLHIFCTPFVPELTDNVRRVLFSVQWPTLQSLIFSGVAVNEWIRLLTSFGDEWTTVGGSFNDLQLQCIRIQGSGKQPVCLSHSSVLFIHRLVYLNPSMELVLENVSLQDQRDSDLVDWGLCSGK